MSTEDLRRAFREAPVAMIFATGFGAGLAPIAPGTAGSAAALVVAGALAVWTSPTHGGSLGQAVGLLMSGLAIAAAAVPLSTRAGRALRAKDPGCVVIDEVAGQLLASSPAPLFLYRSSAAAAAAWIVSFLAFRFFDVVKPGPVRRLQELPEGLGIVADDVLAGLLAAGVTAIVAGILSGGRPWS